MPLGGSSAARRDGSMRGRLLSVSGTITCMAYILAACAAAATAPPTEWLQAPSQTSVAPPPLAPGPIPTATFAAVALCTTQHTASAKGEVAVADGLGISIVPADGGPPTRLTKNVGDAPPAWSPDGLKLAYDSLVSWDTGNTDLFILDPSTATTRRIAHTANVELYPVWSADSRFLAFEAEIRPADAAPHIEVQYIDTETGVVRSIPSRAPFNRQPVWSPSGRAIAFTSSDTVSAEEGSNLNVFDLDSGAIIPLATDRGVDQASWPKWSPDGSTIAVALGNTAEMTSDIALVDARSGSAKLITHDAKGYSRPDWSPDGSRLTYSSLVDGRGAIFVLDILSGKITTVVDDPRIHADAPKWSPDGATIAFVYTSLDPTRIGSERYGRSLGLAMASTDACVSFMPAETFPGGVRVAPVQAWRPQSPN
jgi:TolB protein